MSETLGLTIFGVVLTLSIATLILVVTAVTQLSDSRVAVACIEQGLQLIERNCLTP